MTVTGNGPRVFVTGGAGFIGSYLLNELHRQGYRITLLVRSAHRPKIEDRPALPPGVELVVGDICRPESYRHRLAGHQALAHLAADYRVGLPATRRARRAMYYTNVVGTQTLFDEAQRAEIPHMLYVSSTAALGETHGQLPDENWRHNGVFRSYYEETKHIAHELVAERQRLGMPVNIAIPGGVFGPGDGSILSQTVDAFFQGKIPFQVATDSRFQLCRVDRLCDGLAKLLSPDIQRQTFLFTGDDFSMSEIFTLLASVSGRKTPAAKAVSSLKPLAQVMDVLAAFGLTMPLSKEALRVMDGSTYMYGSDRAKRALGWSAGDPRQELADYLRHRAEKAKG